MKAAPLSTGVEPLRLVGLPPVPVAVSVQAVFRAVPPLSLVTVLRRCKAGALSSLLMVQVTLPPNGTVTCVASGIVAAPQFQAPAV